MSFETFTTTNKTMKPGILIFGLLTFGFIVILPIIHLLRNQSIWGPAPYHSTDPLLIFLISLFGLFYIVLFVWAFKNFKGVDLLLSEEALERHGVTSREERIVYGDITGIEVFRRRSGKLIKINVISPSQSINLHGFQGMPRILTTLEQMIPAEKFVRKTVLVDWSAPITIFILVVTGFVLGYVTSSIHLGKHDLGDLLFPLFFLVWGLSALHFRPISKKWGKGMRGFETFSCILIIISAIMLILLRFVF